MPVVFWWRPEGGAAAAEQHHRDLQPEDHRQGAHQQQDGSPDARRPSHRRADAGLQLGQPGHPVRLWRHHQSVEQVSTPGRDRFHHPGGLTLSGYRATLQVIRTMTCQYALCSLFVPGDRQIILGTKVGDHARVLSRRHSGCLLSVVLLRAGSCRSLSWRQEAFWRAWTLTTAACGRCASPRTRSRSLPAPALHYVHLHRILKQMSFPVDGACDRRCRQDGEVLGL